MKQLSWKYQGPSLKLQNVNINCISVFSSRRCAKYRLYFTVAGLIVLLIVFIQRSSKVIKEPIQHFEGRLLGPLLYDDPKLIQEINKRWLTPPPARTASRSLKHYKEYRFYNSWIFLHNVTRLLFDNTEPGFFVEAGAMDGEYISNSHYLETERGWTGLLVEPDQQSFKEILKKQRNVWASQSCLSMSNYPHQGNLGKVQMSTRHNEMGALQGSSSIGSSMTVDNKYMYDTYEHIQCIPLASILLALNRTFVDVIYLDVEGVEELILDSFPWSSFTINVWLIEHFNIQPPANYLYDDYFVSKMETHGYSMFVVDESGYDYLFVRNYSKVHTKALQYWNIGTRIPRKPANESH